MYVRNCLKRVGHGDTAPARESRLQPDQAFPAGCPGQHPTRLMNVACFIRISPFRSPGFSRIRRSRQDALSRQTSNRLKPGLPIIVDHTSRLKIQNSAFKTQNSKRYPRLNPLLSRLREVVWGRSARCRLPSTICWKARRSALRTIACSCARASATG